MTKRMSPALTVWPSWKRISVMRPTTWGRTSAESTALMRPENSEKGRLAGDEAGGGHGGAAGAAGGAGGGAGP